MKKLIYFFASWCGPCKIMKPIIADIESTEYKVERIDIDKQSEGNYFKFI